VDDAAFRQRLAVVIERLAGELGAAAVMRCDGNDWRVQPARPAASPLWIWGDAWTLAVGFGRASSLIELGYSSKVEPEEELEELEAICRAVIDGQLVEWRKRVSASRWRLTLGDGSVLHGSTNWLLPALPWTRIEQEQFAPYADPRRPGTSCRPQSTATPTGGCSLHHQPPPRCSPPSGQRHRSHAPTTMPFTRQNAPLTSRSTSDRDLRRGGPGCGAATA